MKIYIKLRWILVVDLKPFSWKVTGEFFCQIYCEFLAIGVIIIET